MAAKTIVGTIREIINQLSVHKIFCSKDLLGLATREQIDNILSRLVKSHIIVRLSRGVFCRNNFDDSSLPTIEEIVEAKARVFQRRLGEPCEKLTGTGEIRKPIPMADIVYTTSATSSMNTIKGRVFYKRISARWLKPLPADACRVLTSILTQISWSSLTSYWRTAVFPLGRELLFPSTPLE
jgi:hypothetical protein